MQPRGDHPRSVQPRSLRPRDVAAEAPSQVSLPVPRPGLRLPRPQPAPELHADRVGPQAPRDGPPGQDRAAAAGRAPGQREPQLGPLRRRLLLLVPHDVVRPRGADVAVRRLGADGVPGVQL